jgi:hypothetical protein
MPSYTEQVMQTLFEALKDPEITRERRAKIEDRLADLALQREEKETKRIVHKRPKTVQVEVEKKPEKPPIGIQVEEMMHHFRSKSE